jgi:hypothetical protein
MSHADRWYEAMEFLTQRWPRATDAPDAIFDYVDTALKHGRNQHGYTKYDGALVVETAREYAAQMWSKADQGGY